MTTDMRCWRNLLRTPAWAAWAAIPIGAFTTVASIASNPVAYALPEGVGLVMVVWEYGLQIVSGAVVYAFALHTIHQLRVVSRIHAELVRIDLFKLDPLYEFANLTALTGIAIFAAMAYGIVSLSLISSAQFSVVDAFVVAAFTTLAVGSFVLPLLGLHGRIQRERERQKVEAGEVLETAVGEVETRIREGRYEGMSAVNDALAAATSAYASISRVSTWPWRPDTIRGFVGAIGLPVLIYALTAVLGRFL